MSEQYLALNDTLGRPIRDLRVSVTDRCNFRCTYCMPKAVFGADHPFLPRSALLTYEEIARVARVFVRLGVRKIRLTGGEPLLRRNIERLVEQLARLPDLDDLSVTTNASPLTLDKARLLKDAGLKRVTVSLDALDDATFMAINDVEFPVQKVLDGIANAESVGLSPIKINMVVKRGVNEHSIVPMARFFHGTGHIVRFIEYMDVGHTNGWRMDDVFPASRIIETVNEALPIEPVDPAYRGEVAKRWRYTDGGGEIGVIASVTQPFCRDCSRARLSAEGQLYTCLFATHGHDIRSQVRNPGLTDTDLSEFVRSVWVRRADRYSEMRNAETVNLRKIEMSYIGG
ncbi:MAG: GTP 3',8-cyclase MoaA [Gammaproteobacteria bacterium]|nr:GTP 3',8-cyclase MoaA [Gammaproteobacteria bacterium]